MEENIKTPTRSSFVDLVHYSALARFRDDFAFIRRRQFMGMFDTLKQKYRNKKLWGVVKPLKSLQPYANPRNNYVDSRDYTLKRCQNEVSETYTGDGSVDAKGKPAVKQNTEYWRACWFIIVLNVVKACPSLGLYVHSVNSDDDTLPNSHRFNF
ncbi:hypothetical protein F8388_019655 [Cannabis sativa]|uniref:Uncharacterized protein n=1 Tax=Cannabis sativa TaxID=3483 RepID=A0A7J6DYM9_CANSA|nr:hypothetical protein F8388_019655 [Cannabis sativa]